MGISEIMAAVRRGLRGALDFSGRDTRQQFWPYAIFLFIAKSGLTYLAMIPDMMRMMTGVQRVIEQAQRGQAAGGSGQAPFPSGTQPIPPELIPDFTNTMIWSSILTVIAMLLLATAVTRRLHDRDKRGFWGLMPLPFAVFGLALAPQAFQDGMMTMANGAPPSPLWSLLMINSLFYWVTLIALIVILAGKGTPGPNRFGAES